MPAEGRAVLLHATGSRRRRRAQSGPATLALGRMQLESVITRESLDALYCVAPLRRGRLPLRARRRTAAPDAARRGRGGAPRTARAGSRSRGCCARSIASSPDATTRCATCSSTSAAGSRTCCSRGRCGGTRTTTSEMFEDNRRLMEFLREIDSPVPTPLRVAADVTLTRRILDVTRARALGRGEPRRGRGSAARHGGARPAPRGALRRRAGAARGRGARARAHRRARRRARPRPRAPSSSSGILDLAEKARAVARSLGGPEPLLGVGGDAEGSRSIGRRPPPSPSGSGSTSAPSSSAPATRRAGARRIPALNRRRDSETPRRQASGFRPQQEPRSTWVRGPTPIARAALGDAVPSRPHRPCPPHIGRAGPRRVRASVRV